MALVNLVEEYLKSKTTFALLVNGKWGSGKTHYWKNIVEERIEQIQMPEGSENYIAVYISLYGVESIQEISNIILYRLSGLQISNQLFKGFTRILAKATGSFFNLGEIKVRADEVAAFKKIKRFVICFDDIERITSSEIIQNLLGYINYLAEHEGVKIVILTDEEKLLLNTEIPWKHIKEKIVNQEIIFSKNNRKTLDEIVTNVLSKHKAEGFIRSEFEVLNNAFEKSGTDNFRSLIYGLERFKAIYAICNSTPLQAILPDLLYSILAWTFELKSGLLTFEDFEISKIENSVYYIKEHRSISQLEQKYIEFREKYFSDTYKYIISESLFKYLATGDKDLLFIDELIEKYQFQTSNQKEVMSLNKLNDITTFPIDDAEFANDVDIILNAVKLAQYTLAYYPIAYNIFIELEKKSLLNFSLKEIDQIFLETISKLKTNRLSYEVFADNSLEAYNLKDNWVLDEIRQFNKSLYFNELTHQIKAGFDEMKKTENFNGFFSLQNKLMFNDTKIPVFEFLDIDVLYEYLLVCPAGFINSFHNFLFKNTKSFSVVEKEFVSNIMIRLDKSLTSLPKLRAYVLETLIISPLKSGLLT